MNSAEENATRTQPRLMTGADLPGVVELHKVCFEGYFLTALGDAAIGALYSRAVDDPKSVACVLQDDDGHIQGLAVGTLNPAFHTGLLRRSFAAFAGGVVRGLFTEATVRKGIGERLGFVSKIFVARADDTLKKSGITPSELPEARFLDVAVHPDCRGGRHAERLVEFFASEVFRAGAGRLGGSVNPRNLASLILYKRLGWNVQKTGPDRVDVWVDRQE